MIGVPHPDLGEARGGGGRRAPIRRWTRRRCWPAIADLARFKQPRRILFADALPRNAMGKVQKAALREAHKDLFARLAFLACSGPARSARDSAGCPT